jgi:chromate transport protein ChrA
MQAPDTIAKQQDRPSLLLKARYFLWLGTVGFGGPIALAAPCSTALWTTANG